MSSRVEGPRNGAPIGVGRHKQDNERRNQELQKRAIDGPLTKSFEDPNVRARARKKDSMTGKSFMKATSSSSLKKSMDSRDASPSKGKRRDSSPPKVMSKSDHQVELRRSSSRKSMDNSKRLSVFERLSMDCNKEANKIDIQSSKISDHKGNDKNLVKRKSGIFSDTSVQSVPLRRDSNVRRSARATGKRDSKAEISEKHKSEDKPESSDKDDKEECSSSTVIKAHDSQEHNMSLAPADRHVSVTAATTTHQGGELMGAAAGDSKGGDVPVAQRNTVMPTATARHAQDPPSTARTPTTRTAPPNHSQQHNKRPATKPKDGPHRAQTTTAAGANKPTASKGHTSTHQPETVSVAQPPKIKKKTSADSCKPPKPKSPRSTQSLDTQASSPSVAAVSRLAERVITGQVKPSKGGDSKVMDDDKDVCDDDKASEDREFYRIKVQTRLVSYENNTLVIKNTSKVAEGGEEGELDEEVTGNPEQCHDESCSAGTDSDSTGSLQTSSAEASPMGGSEEKLGEGGFTRSRSLRLKMSSFMNKGKNFLSDVYSTTQQSLQPHLDQIPDMRRSFHEKMSRSMSSECSSLDALSLMSVSSSISTQGDHGDITNGSFPVTDTDSGFYSIHTPREQEHTPLPGTEVNNIPNIENVTDLLAHFNSEEIPPESVQTECSIHDLPCEDSEEGAAPENLIDDDWIKRCIVNCSCHCRNLKDLDSPSAGSLDSGHGSDASIDTTSDGTHDLDLVTHNDGTSGIAPAPPSGGTDIRGECQCECHSSTPTIHDQVSQEVIDLLDVDHARMWWTITGNFGNILPIDWSKTYTRQQYLPVLNLNETKDVCNNSSDEGEGGEEEDVAQDLDLHHLILTGLNDEPVKSAEEVIREIDDIMQEGSSSSEDEGLEETMSCSTETQSTQPESLRPLPPPLYEEKLKNLSVNELNEHYMELEVVIRQYSETLINQLALRDELEYEKELKNSFISLLLQVQNKRRNFNVEKKQKKKYLTTVIPYDVGHGPPSNQTLQILIKILTAINEDSPTVPTLLTDYILKVLCPS